MLSEDNKDFMQSSQEEGTVELPVGFLVRQPTTIPVAQEPCLQVAPEGTLEERLAAIRSNITIRELFAA